MAVKRKRKIMEKNEQRVLELNKIDSKAIAWLAGYQCINWNKMFRWHDRVLQLLQNDHLLEIEISCRSVYDPITNFIHENLAEYIDSENEVISNGLFKKNLDKGVPEEDMKTLKRWRCLYWDRINFRLSNQSISYIGNTIPPVKKEYWPYEIFGMFCRYGYVNKGAVSFLGGKNTIDLLKKQLINWGQLDENQIVITAIPEKYDATKSFRYLKIFGENVDKFIKLLPQDYLEKFDDYCRVEDLKNIM